MSKNTHNQSQTDQEPRRGGKRLKGRAAVALSIAALTGVGVAESGAFRDGESHRAPKPPARVAGATPSPERPSATATPTPTAEAKKGKHNTETEKALAVPAQEMGVGVFQLADALSYMDESEQAERGLALNVLSDQDDAVAVSISVRDDSKNGTYVLVAAAGKDDAGVPDMGQLQTVSISAGNAEGGITNFTFTNSPREGWAGAGENIPELGDIGIEGSDRGRVKDAQMFSSLAGATASFAVKAFDANGGFSAVPAPNLGSPESRLS